MNLHVDLERVRVAHKALCAELLAERTVDRHWVGELAGSPSATAAAVSALVVAHQNAAGKALCDLPTSENEFSSENILQCDLSELIVESLHWLARNQNEDGGWGDATGARSNLAATMLVRAAFMLTGVPAKYDQLTDRSDQYIDSQDGVAGLKRQCKDRLIYTPILANCALAGLVNWNQVPALPFEWACLPKGWRRQLGLQISGYAIPLWVAVGQVKFYHDPPLNPVVRLMRRAVRARSLAAAQAMQPARDALLDSTAWTAFTVMSLASIGRQSHPLVESGLEALLATMRSDASWPIHNNLAVSNTTLAVNALAAPAPSPTIRMVANPQYSADKSTWPDARAANCGGGSIVAAWQETLREEETVAVTSAAPIAPRNDDAEALAEVLDERCLNWLLNCQLNGPAISDAPAGGWGWTDSPGALPDTGDTAGALLALSHWQQWGDEANHLRIELAARRGAEWLLAAQNANGGWPLFARDHSLGRTACDLTAHALRALVAWQRVWKVSPTAKSRELASLDQRIVTAVGRGLEFLEIEQRGDGSFPAIRFGNEHQPDGENLVCGTSRVLLMCGELDLLKSEMARRAARWLLSAQHACGGWGPPRTPLDYSGTYKRNGSQSWRANPTIEKFCSVEETAQAVEAMLPLAYSEEVYARAVHHGLNWLIDAVEQDRHRRPATVGVHFTRLWYHERLYPLAFAASALTRAARQLAPSPVGGPVELPVG